MLKVSIKNYQTSLHTQLDIKGFTVIVGKSNTGKTGILRAIEGSLFNDSVTGNVRHGEKSTQVDLDYNGTAWTWTKGEGENGYQIRLPDGSVKEYSRVGFKVPTEIQDLGFREVLVDKQKLRPQVAAWHSPIFLLDSGGKAVTELMSTITRLDVINLAQRNCGTVLRRSRSTIEVKEAEIISLKNSIQKYQVIDTVDMKALQEAYHKLQTAEKRLATMTAYLERLSQIERRITALNDIGKVKVPDTLPIDKIQTLQKIDTWIASSKKINDRLLLYRDVSSIEIPDSDISHLIQSYQRLTGWVQTLSKLNAKINQDIQEINVPDLNSFLQKVKRHQIVSQYQSKLSDTSISDLNKQIEEHLKKIETDEITLHDLRHQIDICDICGRSSE